MPTPLAAPFLPVSTGRALLARTTGPFVVTLMEHAGSVRLERHRHREAIIGLLLRGRYDERIERRTIEPAPASLLIKPPETPHANHIGREGTDTILIQLLPDRIPVEFARLFDAPAIRHDSRFFALGQAIHEELRCGTATDTLGLGALLTELLAFACERGRTAGTGHSRRQRWVLRVKELLHDHPDSLTLAELAESAGVNRAHLARTFRAIFGCTVGEYVRALRMERAALRLHETHVSVARVATELGYFDQAHFTRAFRTVFGMTPGAWRRAGHAGLRPRSRFRNGTTL